MRAKFFTGMIIAALMAAPVFAQGLRYEPPQIDGYEFPFPDTYHSPLAGGGAILRNESKMFSDTSLIDFEGRKLTFKTVDSAGNTVWTYHYGELNEFITDGKIYSFYDNWYNNLSEKQKRDLGAPAAPKLQWELAVHYPPWAQRLLGNEPPRLKIEGRLELTVAFDYLKTKLGDEDRVDILPFDVITNYEFAIRGSVGRLISVNISHSRQDGFDLGEDPLKNFKVEYKESEPGELEDEIIQEVVVGYTGFDMPGTNLSGYSDKHDGLFGVKVRAKLGPVMLTGIASHAQGEAMTRELGGRNDVNNVTSIPENDFFRNRYFFLDTVYKRYYNEFYNTSAPNRSAARPPRVTNFQAFVSIDCGDVAQSTQRRYRSDMEGAEGSLPCFKMLTENVDYTIDVDRGWVRFESNIREDSYLAVTMSTADAARYPHLQKASIPLATPTDSEVDLRMLKPRNMEGTELSKLEQEDPRQAMLFGLMWRNVYHMPEIEDGKLDLFFYDPAQGDTVRHNDRSVLFSRVMGLTDDQGRARLEVTDIYNMDRMELIIPPWSPDLNGNEPFANPDLGQSRINPMIYTHGSRTHTMTSSYTPRFGMLTNGSAKRDSYDNLGWNILPGTVTVKTKSGTLLVEDEDYYLDYQMGIIDLISARAKSAESILITYQRESDFVLEKKVFAGLRGEMKLPFISENSFMAASVLYQNAATSAGDIPALGNEPFSKLHLNFNTSLDFNPEWMTTAVNKIPLIKTEEESTAKIDFEVVHSRMNPNTAKENGAYLDDFERTKDGYSLSMRHQNWFPSHFPFKYPVTGTNDDILQAISDSLLKRPPAWDFYWFTPNAHDEERRKGLRRFDIWIPDRNDTRYGSADTYVDVLRLHATSAPAGVPELRDRFAKSYASITTSFGRSGLNMENHRYLELIIKPNPSVASNPTNGTLRVQIGTFSHDQVRDGGPPNGLFDIEDPTYQNKPDQLSMYDWGLDGKRNLDEKVYMIPNAGATNWEILDRTDPRLVFPRSRDNPSGDLYRRYDRDYIGNFRWANGTRGNSVFDSENIDYDGVPRINYKERYVEYTINLDDYAGAVEKGYIDTSARLYQDQGWRLYRIPLNSVLGGAITKDTASAGFPDLSKARGIRLVWTDFNPNSLASEQQLFIAGMDLVGNYWETAPGWEDKIEPTSISNYDDLDYYNSVHNYIVKPKSGEQTPQEHSLRLTYKNLAAGDTALVWKNMSYYPQNVSGYDSLTVQVYANTDNLNDLNFVLRFGADSVTFYEYAVPLTRSKEWQRFGFRLQDLSELKLLADVADNEPINGKSSGPLRIVAPAGRRPSFTNITYMAVGVTARGGGEIWVNELMAVSPRRHNGIAARVDVATQWADFLSLSAGASYTDGNFRTMTEPLTGTEDQSEIAANMSARVSVNKFMPDEWGVAIPVGGSISGALSRPTVKPQSDILLQNEDGNYDSFMDMAGDALDLMLGRESGADPSNAERFQTFTTTRNAYTSFEKTSESENPFVNFTLDRITTDVGYSMTASYTGKGPHEDDPENPAADYFRSDTTTIYTGNLRYDLSPRNPPEWTSAEPFANAEWAPEIYKNYTLNLLPSTIMFDIAEVMHRTEKRDDAKLNVHDFTTRTFDLRHGVQVDYTPIDPLLSFGYGLRWDRDVSDLLITADWDVMRDSTFSNIFGLNKTEGQKWDNYHILYGERNRTQSASMTLTPQFVKWMTHSADYNADYTGQLVRKDLDSMQFMNANVSTSLRLRTSLLVGDLFKRLAGDSKEGFAAALSVGAAKIEMRSINAEYDVNTDLKNHYLSSTFLADSAGMSNFDYFKYQLGMGRNLSDYFWGRQGMDGLGYMFYRERYYGEDINAGHDMYRYDQSMGSWSARFSTAFVIPDPFKINITNVSVGWGREFYSQPDTSFIDTTIVLPDVRVSANTELLEKISFIATHLTKLSMSSSFNYKWQRKETRDRTDTTVTIEFMPLIGLDGKFRRWPELTANYRYGTSNTIISIGGKGEEDAGLLSTEENWRHSHALNAAYEFTASGRIQEIKIGRWIIPVQGKTTVGLTVNWDTNEKTYTIIGDENDPVVTEDSEFNYSPYVDYKFTDNIRGQARYLGVHRNQSGMRTTQQRFALTLEVRF